MGLGSVKDNGGQTFLSIAGGFIWDRKAEETHKDYAVQEFEKADKTIGVRKGARYADITGRIVNVEFRTHKEYGENMNVTLDDGDDRYIISVSTNNRNCQDLMKALMVMDLSKDIFIKPYDFIGQDKKRAQGISFRQDGEKLNLKVEVPDEFKKEADWFKNTDKKKIKRFFEDLSDWFVAEIEETIIPNFKPLEKKEKKAEAEETEEDDVPNYEASEPKEPTKTKTKVEEPKNEPAAEPEKIAITPLRMKKVLREYIAENYEGKELPELSKEDLVKWYELCIAEEELPFSEEVSGNTTKNVVDNDDLEAELNKLL